jgi:hypothetical protein
MFRFTIRDVLWLMALVGLCVAWLSDHRRLERKASKLKTDEQMRRAFDSPDFP